MKCNKCGHEYETRVLTVINEVELIFPFDCPKCTQDEEKRTKQALEYEKIAKDRERVAEWILRANIPQIYAGMREYVPKADNQRLFWDFKKPLIFSGSTGSGKTMLACWLAIVGIAKYDKTARYFTHSGMVSRIKATWGSKYENEDTIINDCAKCDLLILDEMDKQEYTDYLFRVLDGRYQNQLPTILIANKTPDDIKQILGDALYSRLRGSNAIVKIFDNIDYRATK